MHFDNLTLRQRVRRGDTLIPRRVERLRGLEEKIQALAEELDSNQAGDYLEFGVFYGNSLARAFSTLSRAGFGRMRFYGFDSFEGLPDEADRDAGHWVRGQFRADLAFVKEHLAAQDVDMRKVVLTKGWYSDTLTPETREELGLQRAGIVMIDCDIYSSTVLALDFCAPLLGDPTFLLFDDWYTRGLADAGEGEKRAFTEFLAKHPDLDAVPLGGYSPTSEVFRVTRSVAKNPL